MSILFKRTSKVTIKGTPIESSDLDIDIMHTSFLNRFPLATITIWNPSDDTIGLCQSKPSSIDPKKEILSSLLVDIGYGGDTDLILNGDVISFSVDMQGSNRKLTIEGSEVGQFRPEVTRVERTLIGRTALSIFLRLAGLSKEGTVINPGDNVFIERFVIKSPLNAVKQLARMSESSYFWRSGRLNVIPDTLIPHNPVVVDKTTGLLDRPEKIEQTKKPAKARERGFKVRTLPLFGVRAGSSIKAVFDNPPNVVEGVIYETKIVFPSTGDAFADHKVFVKAEKEAAA